MLKKRGLYIAIGGAAMVAISFAVASLVLNEISFDQNRFSIAKLLQEMLDEVSEETAIGSGQTVSFPFDATTGTEVLLWGIQILDYESDDAVSVTITNIYGDEFGKFNIDQPASFQTIPIEKSDVYNFNVQNTGQREITVVMMFSKNPDESSKAAFSDPDSTVSRVLVPLAVSGILLILGIIVIIAGAIILVYDHKKRRPDFA
jgi:hypothetical protein